MCVCIVGNKRLTQHMLKSTGSNPNLEVSALGSPLPVVQLEKEQYPTVTTSLFSSLLYYFNITVGPPAQSL